MNFRDRFRLAEFVESFESPGIQNIQNGERKKELFQTSLTDIEIFKMYLTTNRKYEKSFENFSFHNPGNHFSFQEFSYYFSNKILSQLPVFTQEEREKNISKVNMKQFFQLLNHFKIRFFQENIRTLVLYFRSWDMPNFEFLLLYYTLKNLIWEGKTQLFNQLKVVWRTENIKNSIHSYIDPENILHVFWNEFREATSLYSNTIHFTYGSVYEKPFMQTTTQIVGQAITQQMHKHPEKNKNLKQNYIPLYLDFRGKMTFHPESMQIIDLMKTTIQSVLNCEKYMLQKIKE